MNGPLAKLTAHANSGIGVSKKSPQVRKKSHGVSLTQIKALVVIGLLIVLSVASSTAYAEENPQEASVIVLPADPSGKLYEKFQVKRGFGISSDFGVLLPLSGATDLSVVNPYVSVNIGYDIARWFSLYASASHGFSSVPRSTNQIGRIKDYGITQVLVAPHFKWMVWERLGLELKVQGGMAILEPVPLEMQRDHLSSSLSPIQVSVGAGVGVEYYTC